MYAFYLLTWDISRIIPCGSAYSIYIMNESFLIDLFLGPQFVNPIRILAGPLISYKCIRTSGFKDFRLFDPQNLGPHTTRVIVTFDKDFHIDTGHLNV